MRHLPITGGMASAGRFLLLALLALLLAAAPATARNHSGNEPPPGWDGDGWDYGDSAPAPSPAPHPKPDPAPAPAPAPAPPSPEPAPDPELVTTPTVSGSIARLRADGKAAIPRRAPRSVRAIIAAANRIVGRPYKWGGGHARLEDRGYDCSGTVSYPLIKAGLLSSPLVSGTFARWGTKGTGRWVSIYANAGHVYMEVAGLRLDTSRLADPRGGSGPRWRPAIGHRPGFRTRHIAGL